MMATLGQFFANNWFSMFASLSVLVLLVGLARRYSPPTTMLWTIPLGILSLVLLEFTLIAQVFFSFFAFLALSMFVRESAPGRWAIAAAVVPLLLALYVKNHFYEGQIDFFNDALDGIAVESLDDRLPTPDPDEPSASPELSSAANQGLLDFERWEKSHLPQPPQDFLEFTHERATRAFILSEGFGFYRMFHHDMEEAKRELTIRRDNFTSIELPPPPHTSADGSQEDLPASPSLTALESLHSGTWRDFGDPWATGAVIDRETVYGFLPHHLGEAPGTVINDERERWRITQLELIGLLLHEKPVAYVHPSLPRMDLLRDAPTRALSDFEQSALAKLRTDENLVIEPDAKTGVLRMVGALRAAESCLRCHEVHRGELLGAFSYELHPVTEDDGM